MLICYKMCESLSRPSLRPMHRRERKTVSYALVAIDAILGLAVLLLVFLHSGKDAGLSTSSAVRVPSVVAVWFKRTSTG